MSLEGGCNCGAVRYRIAGDPVAVAQCHCRNCQRQSGSAFSLNLLVRASAAEIAGILTTYEDRDTESGRPVLRKFCGTCGSPIVSVPTPGNGMLIVKAGTLDDPAAVTPRVSVWTDTRLPWVALPEAQRTFPRNAG